MASGPDDQSGERAAELALARACARGDPGGIAALETKFISAIPGAVRRLHLDADALSEVQQRVRAFLLVGEGGRAGIADFRGKGPLKAFVRIIALREGLRLKGAYEHEVPIEDVVSVERPGEAPELSYLRKAHGAHLKRALRDAMATLDPNDRTLLRQYFVDGLSIDELGRAWRIHRATAARRVTRAHQELLEQTRRLLRERLDLSDNQIQSVVRAVASQFDMSLATALKSIGP